MGCLKLTYQEESEQNFFQGVWKKDAASKNCDNYYPFGLTFNSYQRENSLVNRFVKFQGQEHVDDLGLNWDSFKWRNHQPDIGRFFNVDPLAEKYYYNSPYAFSENKVVAHVELEGLEAVSFASDIEGPPENVRNELKRIDDAKTISPVVDPVISSEFGPRVAPLPNASDPHPGIDIVRTDASQTAGTQVVAPVNGKVISIKNESDGNGAGNRISIKAASDGKVHNFFHLQGNNFAAGLEENNSIVRGAAIGNVGTTGTSTAPHLHYEVRQNGTALNPRNENSGLTNAPTTEQARSANTATVQPYLPANPIPLPAGVSILGIFQN